MKKSNIQLDKKQLNDLIIELSQIKKNIENKFIDDFKKKLKKQNNSKENPIKTKLLLFSEKENLILNYINILYDSIINKEENKIVLLKRLKICTKILKKINMIILKNYNEDYLLIKNSETYNLKENLGIYNYLLKLNFISEYLESRFYKRENLNRILNSLDLGIQRYFLNKIYILEFNTKTHYIEELNAKNYIKLYPLLKETELHNQYIYNNYKNEIQTFYKNLNLNLKKRLIDLNQLFLIAKIFQDNEKKKNISDKIIIDIFNQINYKVFKEYPKQLTKSKKVYERENQKYLQTFPHFKIQTILPHKKCNGIYIFKHKSYKTLSLILEVLNKT